MPFHRDSLWRRACLKNTRGSAARDFGRSRGGEAGQSPQRAWPAEPTTAAAKSTAARRVFAPKALWLRCSSVEDPPGIFFRRRRAMAGQAFVESEQIIGCPLCGLPRQRAFGAKTEPLVFFRHALRTALLRNIKHNLGAFPGGLHPQRVA